MMRAMLAGAAGALAAAGAVLVVPRSMDLPGPLRSFAARIGEELGSTLDLVREVGSARAPLPRARVRRLRVTAAAAGAVSARSCSVCAGRCSAQSWRAGLRRVWRSCAASATGAGLTRDALPPPSRWRTLSRAVPPCAPPSRLPPAACAARLPRSCRAPRGSSRWARPPTPRSSACDPLVSRAVTLIVAAMQVQRRSGGDLPGVLRDVGMALEQERRLLEEARAATAQARFTAVVVIALPGVRDRPGHAGLAGLDGRMMLTPRHRAARRRACAAGLGRSAPIRRLAGRLREFGGRLVGGGGRLLVLGVGEMAVRWHVRVPSPRRLRAMGLGLPAHRLMAVATRIASMARTERIAAPRSLADRMVGRAAPAPARAGLDRAEIRGGGCRIGCGWAQPRLLPGRLGLVVLPAAAAAGSCSRTSGLRGWRGCGRMPRCASCRACSICCA